MRILSVAFSLGMVAPDSVGGAEQVLWQLDRGIRARGHESWVIASEGSQVSGTLVPIQLPDGLITDKVRAQAHLSIRSEISKLLKSRSIDLVHLHGIDFSAYLPRESVPVLVTLHLPVSWYDRAHLQADRPDTYFHCVSRSQHESITTGELHPRGLLPWIENGIPLELMERSAPLRRRSLTTALGRICPEKGFDTALRASKAAKLAMFLAGRIFPYPEHEAYFASKILPELDHWRRFIGAVTLRQRRRLLGMARALLIPSRVAETSSLVAREALACGTPVVAFRVGALPEIIDPGRTGFLVDTEEEMIEAIRHCGELNPDLCRQFARESFSSEQMVERYLNLYRQILGGSPETRSS